MTTKPPPLIRSVALAWLQTNLADGPLSWLKGQNPTVRLIPDDELVGLARARLFEIFEDLHRFHHIRSTDVHETDACQGIPDFQVVTYGIFTRDSCGLSAIFMPYEREKVAEFVRRAGDAVHRWSLPFTVVVRRHTGTCPTCRGSRRMKSVAVSCEWAGRTLTLEYAL